MNKPVLVDTDVMVDYLRGRREAVAFVYRHADHVVLPAVVVAELYAGVKGEAEREALDDLVAVFRVVPVTAEIAREAGLLRREYGPSHGVGLGDGIVAASALSLGASLATLNVRHFPMLKGLKPPYSRGGLTPP